MKRILPVLLAFMILTPAARGDTAVDLCQALRQKLVAVEAVSPGGYKAIRLTIRNLTERTLLLDPAGSYLCPQGQECQRIGMGSVVTTGGRVLPPLIRLIPRGVWTGLINACCLDESLPGPATGTVFVLMPTRPVPLVFQALKLWSTNPKLPQSKVNDTIWGKTRLEVLRQEAIDIRVRGSRLVADGGRLYWLSGLSVLYRLDDAGASWRVLARGVATFSAQAGELVIYDPGSRFMQLYNETHRAFERAWYLPVEPRTIRPGPRKTLYLLGQNGSLYRYAHHAGLFRHTGFRGILDLALTPNPVRATVFAVQGKPGRTAGRILVWNEATLPKSMRNRPARQVGSTLHAVYARTDCAVYRHSGCWRRILKGVWSVQPGRGMCYFFQQGKANVFHEQKGCLVNLPLLSTTNLCTAVDRTSDEVFVLTRDGRVFCWKGRAWKPYRTVPLD